MANECLTQSDEAKKKLLEKKRFMMNLIGEFEDFVSDAMEDNMHEDFEDHFVFLKAMLEVFEDFKEEV